jgi:hypothetical protein
VSAGRGAASAAVLALALVGCPPHEDVTPEVRVVPGAAARAAWIGRARAAEARAEPARVHPLRPGDELGGPNAIGRPGDLVLENGEVIFVVDGLAGGGIGFAESGGNVVDAADARVRVDELGHLGTFFGTFPRHAVYDHLESGQTEDGAAWIEARGHDLDDRAVSVVTRYTLRGGDRALLIETTLGNGGAAPVKLSLGDAVQWGGLEKFSPDRGAGFRGRSSGPYLAGIGRGASLALTSTDGAIEAISGGAWSDTVQQDGVEIAPGKSVQYARVLVVGQRPDLASVVSELSRAAGQPVGTLHVQLRAGGRPVPQPAGGKILLSRGGKPVLTVRTAKEVPSLDADLPPGPYEVSWAGGGGRPPVGAAKAVLIEAGKTQVAELEVGEAAHATFLCTDPGGGEDVPCKLTFEGLGITRTPDFGPDHVAGAAKNQLTMVRASTIELEPGHYRVFASRGPEFALDVRELDVADGGVYAFAPRRVVDTSGYLACDFHQHTALGADAPTGVRDRVVSNAAEGVEIAVATEHNFVAELGAQIAELGVRRRLVSIPGVELSSDANRSPWGHANAFPLVPDAAKPRAGAVAVRDRTAKEVFDAVRAMPQPLRPVLQVNHPRSDKNGYFKLLGFDPARATATGAGWDGGFDALEVWNGRDAGTRDAVIADFLALLRAAHPVTPTANTDTHGVVGQEPGYPRTYVRVSDDDHLATWDAARTRDLLRGLRDLRDVVLTNGPMLRVRAAGAGIGGLARSAGKKLVVEVHLESAPWIVPDAIEIRRAVGPALLRPVAPRLAPSGALVTDEKLVLDVERDDAFVVLVRGTRSLAPIVGGDVGAPEPFAMSGPVWIDADGDGRSLGR